MPSPVRNVTPPLVRKRRRVTYMARAHFLTLALLFCSFLLLISNSMPPISSLGLQCSSKCSLTFTTVGSCQKHRRTCPLYHDHLSNVSRQLASALSSAASGSRSSRGLKAVHQLKRRREIGGTLLPKVIFISLRVYVLDLPYL